VLFRIAGTEMLLYPVNVKPIEYAFPDPKEDEETCASDKRDNTFSNVMTKILL
jgi:hypothetical protein